MSEERKKTMFFLNTKFQLKNIQRKLLSGTTIVIIVAGKNVTIMRTSEYTREYFVLFLQFFTSLKLFQN